MKKSELLIPFVCERCDESALSGMVVVLNRGERFTIHETFCEIPGDVRVYYSETLGQYVTVPED
jgi:hypothetical protein